MSVVEGARAYCCPVVVSYAIVDLAVVGILTPLRHQVSDGGENERRKSGTMGRGRAGAFSSSEDVVRR